MPSLTDLITSIVQTIVGNDPYRAVWSCKVEKQNANGSLDVIPEDPLFNGVGLRGVTVRYGVAGWKNIKVKKGTSVALTFLDGNPERPFLLGFLDTDADAVFNNGTQPVARVDDTVNCGTLIYAPGTPGALSYQAPNAPAPVTVTEGTQLEGVITTGNERLKA